MNAMPIRYRYDGPGPCAFLVEIDGLFHLVAHGEVGAPLPTGRVRAMLAERGCRWVPAEGMMVLGQERPGRPGEAVPPVLAGVIGASEASPAF